MPNNSSIPAPHRNRGHITRKENIPRESPVEARRQNRAYIHEAVTQCLEVGQSPEEGVTCFFARSCS